MKNRKDNKHIENLNDRFYAVKETGVTTLKELQEPEFAALYTGLWLAAKSFINYCALCSKSRVNSKGKRIEGNAAKVRILVSCGFDIEDIRGNVLCRVFDKMDHILAQPHEKQLAYTYKIINNYINDELRKIAPYDVIVPVVPFDGEIKGKNGEDTYKLYDVIAAPDTVEDVFMAKETVREFIAARKNAVLNEIACLAKRPAEVFVHLCSKQLGMKTAAIRQMLIEHDLDECFAIALIGTAENNGIPVTELRAQLANAALDREMFKLDTCDEKKVLNKLYKLTHKANEHLKRDDRS